MHKNDHRRVNEHMNRPVHTGYQGPCKCIFQHCKCIFQHCKVYFLRCKCIFLYCNVRYIFLQRKCIFLYWKYILSNTVNIFYHTVKCISNAVNVFSFTVKKVYCKCISWSSKYMLSHSYSRYISLPSFFETDKWSEKIRIPRKNMKLW